MDKSNLQEIRNRIFQRWGDVDYEIINYGTAREPITIKCLCCNNIFTLQHRNNLFNKAKKNFCTYCSGTHQKKTNYFIDYNKAQERLQQEFKDEYEIIQDSYKGWTKRCLIKHNLCGKIFETQPRYLFYHSHCPCYTIKSKGENKIKKILEKYDVEYEEQKRLPSIKKAPYDFYLPQHNLLIEFQGRQHFEPVASFGGEKQFILQQEIDKRKLKTAKEQNFEVLYISYKEMNLIEQILVQRLSLKGVDSSESKNQSPHNED